ncbi:MAG: GspE/PulE family protein [Proteobacteria bacterium]|nr:GspE/PulE family protein [Pseudomonadota bacterium]
MLKDIDNTGSNTDVNELKSEVQYRTKLQDICNKIYSAQNLDEILINTKEEIASLFEADRLTIYYVDGVKREIVSRFKSGDEIAEIRVPISPASVAGCSVFKRKLLNIADVYDQEELAGIDSDLKFDSSWDKKTGFRTKQVLATPINFKNFQLGAIQLINRSDGTKFTKKDEDYVQELSKIMGIALYNQKRIEKSKSNKFDHLLKNQILTQKDLTKATEKARQTGKTVEAILMDEFSITKSVMGECLGVYFDVPYIEYNQNLAIPGDLLVNLKIPFMKKNTWVPIRAQGGKVVIAVDNPQDVQKIGVIKSLFPKHELEICFCFAEDILRFIELFTQDEQHLASMDEILSQMKEDEEEVDEAESGVSEESSAIVQLVNKIIIDAHARNCSDIHIEPFPGKQHTQVRMRVDGACSVYQTIPYHYRNAIVSRLKIMSDLDIAERRKPQDGKIGFKKYGGLDIELRVATVPTQGGMEDVVMRILAAGEPIPLEKMGFSKNNFENFISVITKPYGIVFVCGPTGSGKTTTLHSALGYINKPEVKIWTAEDPVEITQKGLRQVQVQPKIGFDFAAAMRAFLRADPDIIMVGEMRDKETTQIGIEASLTGHLVFSTLHTNSAPESVTRLLDMGMDPFNFADAILCILAQRLVRTLCKKCKKEYHPAKEEYDELVREYGDPVTFKKNELPDYNDNLVLFMPNGCDACNNTGYSGRMGLHELLMGTNDQKRMIQESARVEELRGQAIKDGMTTLKQDGIAKIFSGHCDLIQVRKVCIQ